MPRRFRFRTRPLRALTAAAVASLALVGLGGCIPTPRLTVTTAVSGLDIPWDVGFANGTMIYTERAGGITAVVGGQKRLLAHPTDVVVASEAGMMGLAIDPAFDSNRYIYTCFASTLGGPNNDVRLVRWKVNANFTCLTDRTDILTGVPVNTTGELGRHSGCRPRFDGAGRLWVGTGDAATGSAPQDPRSLGGKVLRIDRDGKGLAGNPGGALDPRIWSYGHRNVQGIAFRADGLGVSVEHGPDQDDELNLLVAGNFGWNPVPAGGGPGYNEAVPMTDLQKFPGAIEAMWRSGSPTVAPSGATFINGAQWRTWDGTLAVAMLKGSKLYVFRQNALGGVTDMGVALQGYGRLRTPVQGPDGSLYVTTANGGGTDRILKVTPN
jgi:aldose sugar dehydrogenase